MKTLLAILAIATVVGFCGAGAFVAQTPDTIEGLIVLNDEALAQKVGGEDKTTSSLSFPGHGDKASCSVASGCDPAEKFWTNSKYNCVDCTQWYDNAYVEYEVDAVIRSYCEAFQDAAGAAKCRTISEVLHQWDSCDNYQGACGT